MGTPLAFNWQSATFSVTSVVGYLFPVRLAYSVAILLSILIAGTGAYVFGRVLGLGIVASAFAGTIFELSGPFVGWLGWPLASVVAWAGWLFAAAVLIVHGHRRVRHIAGFALLLMCAVYAGHPETLFLLICCLVAFILVFLGFHARWLKESTPIMRPLVDLVLAFAAGFALAAPLLLPGLQLLHASLDVNAQLKSYSSGVPVSDLVNVIFQGYSGLPVSGSWFFGHGIYSISAAYMGVIAVVLAGVGIVMRRNRPEVIALVVGGLGVSMIGFDVGIGSMLDKAPVIGTVGWSYALLPMAFVAAMLAGVGADVLVRSRGNRTVLAWSAGGFAMVSLVLLLLWTVGRGHLNPTFASIRAHSFVLARRRDHGRVGGDRCTGPALSAADGARVIGGRLGASGWGAVVLLACETAFLLTAGMPLFSSASSIPQPTPAEATLHASLAPRWSASARGSAARGSAFGTPRLRASCPTSRPLLASTSSSTTTPSCPTRT